jgi:hypothetical protein
MATLTGRAPKDTYKDLLQISNSNAGIDTTLRTIEDGEGTSGTIQLSTTAFNILSTATWTAAADLTFTQANPEIKGGDADGVIYFGPSTTNALGGNIVLYGESHATQANDIELRATATAELHYDDSGNLWDFQANAITTSGAGTFTGGITSGGNIVSDTDSTDDLGTTGVRWANLYVDDITTTTTMTAGTSVVGGTMTMAGGSLTDSSGAISFGNENLSTTGTLASGDITLASGDITLSGHTSSYGYSQTRSGAGNSTYMHLVNGDGDYADIGVVGTTGDFRVDLSTAGASQFVLDGTTGNATFAGDVSIGSGDLVLGASGTQNGHVNSAESVFINIDSDNSQANREFVVAHNNTGGSGTKMFSIDESGEANFHNGIDLKFYSASDTYQSSGIGYNETGYSSSYRGVQVGADGNSGMVFLGCDVSGNTSSNFVGSGEVMIGNGNRITAPNNANNNYIPVIECTTGDAILIAAGGAAASCGGNFTVTGALSKGSGSFRIPHPLPEKDGYDLVHSFVESPRAENLYSGMVDLVAGKATVNLDEHSGMTEGTFVALNELRSWSSSNESGWEPVKCSVAGNILTIECKDPASTDKVYWEVRGERKDQHMFDTDWTDENGKVIVEPLTAPKPELPKTVEELEAEAAE